MKTLAVKYRFCSRLLVVLAVLCFSFSNAVAIPLSDYRVALELAIDDIESVIETDDHESDADYQTRLTKTFDAIRARLPTHQQVESDKGNWTADNTWLHMALDELQHAPTEERPDKLASLLERVRALDARVRHLEYATNVEGDSRDAAKQKMESILARPEYSSAARGPNALTRLIRDLIRWIQSWLPESAQVRPGGAGIVSFLVQITVVATAVFLILYVGRLLFIRFRRPRKDRIRKKREARIVLGERLKPEDTATDLLAEAEALARNGDLRAAIRKAYIALLVELGDRNVISLAQYKTNRDYLRSVSNRPQLHSPLKKLTDSFERHWYGVAQATPNDWQDFRAGYTEALQTGN